MSSKINNKLTKQAAPTQQKSSGTAAPKFQKDSVFNGEREITVQDIRNTIPSFCFEKNEAKFLVSVAYSLSFTLLIGYLSYAYIPLTKWMIPVWIVYAIVCGTVATGLWVLGHECGHGSFSKSKLANDVLGFTLHTALLVPYFSWQHSHAVHHAKNNHLTLGETHVPVVQGTPKGATYLRLREIIGVESFSLLQVFLILFVGWPTYLMFGFTGGPARGFTSHFIVPNGLFPKDQLFKVGLSNAGLLIMIYFLYLWAQATSFYDVLALYIGPYLIVNCYLTGITFLQHTEEEIPHYDETAWTWLKGALCTVDRNYPAFINALQFDIGSTHVVHHLFSDLPHYNAAVANEYVKQILGNQYYVDKKPVSKALFDSGQLACVEHEGNGVYQFR